MRRETPARTILAAFICLALLLAAGCAGPAGVPPASPTKVLAPSTISVEEQAALEATAIVARARATALIEKAEAEAAALAATGAPAAQKPGSTSAPASAKTPAAGHPAPAQTSINEEEYRIELLDVGFAADGDFILVRFHATRKAADDLWPGRLSVTDEASGVTYAEVPLMPTVGLLIGRPRSFGPPGYVMFTNAPTRLAPGSLVTVRLGKLNQEHVRVADH